MSGSLAGRLERLFDLKRKTDGTRWPYSEVAEQINQRHHCALMTELAATLKSEGRSAEEIAEAVAQQAVKSVITGQYIGQLVSGAADNPTRIRMQCLAEFFDMDPSFFFDGEKAAMMDRELEMLQLLKNPHVRTLARAADRLDKSGLAAVLAIMGHMKVAPQVSVPDEDDQARPDGS